MDDSVDTSFVSEGTDLFVDLQEAQPCLWDQYIDLTLAYILDHTVCCASGASWGRSLHLITSQLGTKHSSSNCPNHVWRSKSSVKKRIIVRRTVRSRFGEQTVRPVRSRL